MIFTLLTEHNSEFLSLKRSCTGSSESTHVKIPHCWKSHVAAKILIYMTVGTPRSTPHSDLPTQIISSLDHIDICKPSMYCEPL